jgi:hypothetical protein
MPRLTGEQLKERFKAAPKETSAMLGWMLRDFGYPNATDEAVEKEINAQLAGAKPCNLNYGLWLQTYLRDGVD